MTSFRKEVIGNATLYLGGDVIYCRNENQPIESALAYPQPAAQTQTARDRSSCNSAAERLCANR